MWMHRANCENSINVLFNWLVNSMSKFLEFECKTHFPSNEWEYVVKPKFNSSIKTCDKQKYQMLLCFILSKRFRSCQKSPQFFSFWFFSYCIDVWLLHKRVSVQWTMWFSFVTFAKLFSRPREHPLSVCLFLTLLCNSFFSQFFCFIVCRNAYRPECLNRHIMSGFVSKMTRFTRKNGWH